MSPTPFVMASGDHICGQSHEQELLLVHLLDVAGSLVGTLRFPGSRHGGRIDLRVLADAICEDDCRYLLLAHNHPSGDPRPSRADIGLTRAVAALARALRARLLDHRIVAAEQVFSFRAAGLI